MQDLRKWYKEDDGKKPRIPPETGSCKFFLDEEKNAYSLVVEDLDVTKLPESKMKDVAEEINRLCEDLGIPGRVYLVPA